METKMEALEMESDCLWLQTGKAMSENLLRKASNVSMQLQETRWIRHWVNLGSFFDPESGKFYSQSLIVKFSRLGYKCNGKYTLAGSELWSL